MTKTTRLPARIKISLFYKLCALFYAPLIFTPSFNTFITFFLLPPAKQSRRLKIGNYVRCLKCHTPWHKNYVRCLKCHTPWHKNYSVMKCFIARLQWDWQPLEEILFPQLPVSDSFAEVRDEFQCFGVSRITSFYGDMNEVMCGGRVVCYSRPPTQSL